MNKPCDARVLGEEFTIEGTTETCHYTKECGMPGFKKIVIDDGDAFFTICTKCFTRFMTKGSRNSTWYGWFDCDYPPEARVRGSKWWRETAARGRAALAEQEVKAVIQEIDDILSQSGRSTSSDESEKSVDPPPQPKSKKEMLEGRIAELNAFLKSPAKKTQKEVMTATRDIMKLKTELKLLK
jgi:hypothetical protein